MSRQLQFGIAAVGALAVAAIFLPLVSGLGIDISLWDMKDAAPGRTYLYVAGCTAGAIGGGFRIARGAVAVVGFAAAAFALRSWIVQLPDLAYGGKLMVGAILVGLVASVALLAQCVQRRADGTSASS